MEIFLWIGWILLLAPSALIILYASYMVGKGVVFLILYEIPKFKSKFEELEVLICGLIGLLFLSLGVYFFFKYNVFATLALVLSPFLVGSLIIYFRK